MYISRRIRANDEYVNINDDQDKVCVCVDTLAGRTKVKTCCFPVLSSLAPFVLHGSNGKIHKGY